MPGFPVLTTIQPIAGVDMHKSLPPPPPAGPLMLPHPVVWGSGLSQKTAFMWAIAATSRAASTDSGCLKPTVVGFGHACGRTHDAGPHLGHIWPNALLPLILLGSSSKAEFGSGTVQVGVSPQAGGSADMGVNMAYVFNMNLDCQDFPLPPMPTGFSFTIHYNVTAGFGLNDLLRGLVQMAFDLAATWLVGLASAGLGALLKGLFSRLFTNQSFMSAAWASFKGNFTFTSEAGLRSAMGLMNDGAGFFASNGRLFAQAGRFMPAALANAWKAAPVDQAVGVAGTAVGTFVVGSPIGYAPENAAVFGWNPNSPGSQMGTTINNLFR